MIKTPFTTCKKCLCGFPVDIQLWFQLEDRVTYAWLYSHVVIIGLLNECCFFFISHSLSISVFFCFFFPLIVFYFFLRQIITIMQALLPVTLIIIKRLKATLICTLQVLQVLSRVKAVRLTRHNSI